MEKIKKGAPYARTGPIQYAEYYKIFPRIPKHVNEWKYV